MTISFCSYKEQATFHDPMQEGKLIHRETEIRYDPLTNESSRIVFDPGAPFVTPDYEEIAKRTEGSKCPFCTDNVQLATPRYPESVFSSGRLIEQEAVLFPNLFPYAKHNAVVRMTDGHYMKLEQFEEKQITSALQLAIQYLNNVVSQDQASQHLSINWNYLPPSGGSILHPHLHILASERASNNQRLVAASSQSYYGEYHHNYFLALAEAEKEQAVRWIGQEDELIWIHAYAPKSHFDFIGIAQQCDYLADFDTNLCQSIARSLIRFFAYFHKAGAASFNMSIFIPAAATPYSKVHIRFVPRFTTGLLATSDINVLNFLHGEYLSLKNPEQNALDARQYFT